ncbi:hypothetical protein SAMN05444277_12020 [Parafilimonas terrae]|uniref:Uncharacterized protein n=1 Tax=Parafilimonas terrae TaxID=1465490 RepID=A0A1I5ZDZ4_9BACT|nr:hypothetical protein SAMN05444277_12020 [Parafilimonas terrae]
MILKRKKLQLVAIGPGPAAYSMKLAALLKKH